MDSEQVPQGILPMNFSSAVGMPVPVYGAASGKEILRLRNCIASRCSYCAQDDRVRNCRAGVQTPQACFPIHKTPVALPFCFG